MSKPAYHIIKFLIVILVLLFTVNSFAANNTVLSKQLKFSPQDTLLAAVKRQIRSSYEPAGPDKPVLLNRVKNTKRRPVRQVVASNSSFHKKLSARSAIVMDAKTGETIYAHAPDRPGQPASTIKVLLNIWDLHGNDIVSLQDVLTIDQMNLFHLSKLDY